MNFEFAVSIVLAVAFTLIGIGCWSNVSPLAARVCFSSSALMTAAAAVWIAFRFNGSDSLRYTVSGLIGALLLAGLVWLLRSAAPPAKAEKEALSAFPPQQNSTSTSVTVNGSVSGDVAHTIVKNNYNRTIINRSPIGDTNNIPQLHSPKVALFFVLRDSTQDTYDIGIVLKLFNLENHALLIQGIGLDAAQIGIIGRGSWVVQSMAIYPTPQELLEDRFIKAGDVGYYKILLPVEFKMTRSSTSPMPTPEMALNGRWFIGIEDKKISAIPELQSTAEYILSKSEWESLLKPSSKIQVEDLKYGKPKT